jgi:hypothetical protein
MEVLPFSSREIARRRGCTVNAVNLTFFHAKERIRRSLGVQHAEAKPTARADQHRVRDAGPHTFQRLSELPCYLRGARHAVGTTRNGRLLLARGAVQGSAFRGPAHPAWGDDEGVTSTRSGVSDNSAFSDSRQPLPPSTQSGPYLFIRRCSSCARIARVSAIRCTIPSRPRVSWSLTAVPGAASSVSISRR